jgi:hypothetical protein
MTFAGRTFSEYFSASRKFLAITFIIAVISVAGRLSDYYPPGIQLLLLLLGLVVLGWAGWAAVRYCGFNLIQTGLVGFLLSFGSHWALPIFHSIGELTYLFLVNSIIFVGVTGLGGLLAKKTTVR